VLALLALDPMSRPLPTWAMVWEAIWSSFSCA
jgi:hypothetical protein